MNADTIFENFINTPEPRKSGRRGYKTCPQCNEQVGVRTKVCDCGNVFSQNPSMTQKQKDALKNKPTDEELLYAQRLGCGGVLVYAYTEETPDIYDLTQNSIDDYCNMLTHFGSQENKIVTPNAIKHTLMHKFGYNSKEYADACKYVDVWYHNILGKNYEEVN